MGMTLGDQAHLLGQIEIEIENPAAMTSAGGIIDIGIWNRVTPGMPAVYLVKLPVLHPILGKLAIPCHYRYFTKIV